MAGIGRKSEINYNILTKTRSKNSVFFSQQQKKYMEEHICQLVVHEPILQRKK
jgi:hypothetical protein